MGTVERRDRERQRVRKRILDAARRLFAQKGYDAVTMRELAAKIDYSATALYFHFRDKETLFRELCTEDFGEFASRFAELMAEEGLGPLERLRRSALAYLEFAERAPNQYRLLFMTPHPRARASDTAPGEHLYALLRKPVEQAVELGVVRPEVGDPDLLVQVLWAALHGVVSLHLTLGEETHISWRPARQMVETMIEALARGLAHGPIAELLAARAASGG